MKKLIALIALVFLFSCESDEECKMCTMVCTYPHPMSSMPTVSVSMFKACGDELDIESTTSTVVINNRTVTVTCVINCKDETEM